MTQWCRSSIYILKSFWVSSNSSSGDSSSIVTAATLSKLVYRSQSELITVWTVLFVKSSPQRQSDLPNRCVTVAVSMKNGPDSAVKNEPTVYSGGEINFHILRFHLCTLFHCRLRPYPQISKLIHMCLLNPQRLLCPSSAIPLIARWVPAGKQTADGWTVIQMQTYECCWQSLVRLQVAFVCLLESPRSHFSPSCLNMRTRMWVYVFQIGSWGEMRRILCNVIVLSIHFHMLGFEAVTFWFFFFFCTPHKGLLCLIGPNVNSNS